MKNLSFLVRENGGEVDELQDATPTYQIRVLTQSGSAPVITNDATLSMKVFKNGSDVTNTFTTGSMSVSGDVITTKSFTGLIGGDQLHVVIYATVDGIFKGVARFYLNVLRNSGY